MVVPKRSLKSVIRVKGRVVSGNRLWITSFPVRSPVDNDVDTFIPSHPSEAKQKLQINLSFVFFQLLFTNHVTNIV